MRTQADVRLDERGDIYRAVPVGYENRVGAAKIAVEAKVNRRSCGTKLSSMEDPDGLYPSLRSTYDEEQRLHLWWRRAAFPSRAERRVEGE